MSRKISFSKEITPINMSKDLTKIVKDLYYNHHSTPEDLLEPRLPEANYFFVFNQNDDLIGITSYIKKTNLLAMTERTILFPKYRGQGFGAAISERAEGELRKRGFKKIVCEIFTENIAMIIIKIKQGFLVEGLMRNHDKPGVDQYYLGKELK